MNQSRITLTAIALAAAQLANAQTTAQTTDSKMTEVVITANRIAADRSSVAGFADAPLLQTPASVSVITHEQMQDLQIRNVTDASKYDASIGDAYNAVGYAEQFSIRGFKLDNASSYRKDGHIISGDTQIPLENKESLEVLKGLAGLQMGVSAPGGVVNFVTKRPTENDVRSALFEVSERGTLYGAVDLGGRFEDRRFGYRINAASERLRSYVKGADGHRNFISGAFDWQITPQALLQIDADYQNKSQLTAPGYQLIGGTQLPNVDADVMLNDQPWAKPVKTKTSNFGATFKYQFSQDWQATVSANQHIFKRDDYTAFPYGCSSEELFPGYCANGDYDVYDYKSLGEEKKPFDARAQIHGKFATGAIRHEVTGGLSFFRNKESWGDYQYDFAGVSNIYHPIAVPPAPGSSGPVSERRHDNERAVYLQDIVGLTDAIALHAGARYVQAKRDELGVEPSSHNFWLPNVALVYSPRNDMSFYASYAQGLQHGGVAPIETTNANRALEPGKSKQVEVGAKAIVSGISLTAALFQIDQGLEYTDQSITFVRNGQDRHRGLELSAQGRVTKQLNVGASIAALHTEQSGTGQDIYDGKRVTNVPNFRTSVYADYAVAEVPGLKVDANWQYSGKKAFDEMNTTFVPSYHVLNLGGSYATKVGNMPVVIRAQVRNALDKFYWRDVTPDLGGYLFPGAPRTFRVSAQFDF
jgi:iron complex outermembrane receptor protein